MSWPNSFYSWRNMQTAMEHERQRTALLNQPPPKNDPELFKPTTVRVLKSFCIGGRPVKIESTVEIEMHLARDLAAIGKVEII